MKTDWHMTDTIVFILALASPLSRNRLHLQHMTDTSFHLLCQSFVAEAYAYEIMDWPKREWTGPWLSWMLWLTVASTISLCQKVTLLVQLHYWVPNICLRVPKRERERERERERRRERDFSLLSLLLNQLFDQIWHGDNFYMERGVFLFGSDTPIPIGRTTTHLFFCPHGLT